ncbi:Six-hairpin glycosidase [Flagelloscypha sp. PMI_526]|nr:Six-hairpin glycosidase [Flagelloscypha sp. PMI_526]
MKFSGYLLAILSIPGLVKAATSYAAWTADSVIRRNQSNGLDSSGAASLIYDHGTFWEGLRQLYLDTGNTTYYNWILTGATRLVDSSGKIIGKYDASAYQLDPLRLGPTFLYLYSKTGDAKWKTAAATLRKQLETHPRTPEGQFWHKLVYTQQGWLDGIYMGDVFYAQYTKAFQPTNTTAFQDVQTQFTVQKTRTVQNSTDGKTQTGLLYHGYDYSKAASWASSDRGHSPEIWDRALGWYFMAMVDTLEILGSGGTGYSAILAILQELAPKLAAAADSSTGGWWLVMTQPGKSGNYIESSGTAMFVYSLLKAVRLGYVTDSDGKILAAAKKAYTYMTTAFVTSKTDGTFDWGGTVEVGSLSGAGDYAYYISVAKKTNDVKGLAAFLLLASNTRDSRSTSLETRVRTCHSTSSFIHKLRCNTIHFVFVIIELFHS